MNHVKRFLAVFLSFTMAISVFSSLRLTGFAAEIVESGACGDNAAYTLDDEGNLVITGAGAVEGVSFRDRTDIITVSIDDQISSLPEALFAGCSELGSAHLPSFLTKIPTHLFNYCINLTQINIPSSIQVIGSGAFLGTGLEGDLILPGSVNTIESYAFGDCRESYIFIPAGVTEIGFAAFETYGEVLQEIEVDENNPCFCSYNNCLYSKDMTSLYYAVTERYQDVFELPDSVTFIEDCAFEGSCWVNSFSVSENNPSYKVTDDVLFTKNGDTLVRYPSNKESTKYTVPAGVTTLNYGAFSHVYSLRYLILPDTLTSIEAKGISCCSSLKSLRIPDGVSYLGNWMLNYCTSLKEITLSAGLTRVGDQTFSECSALESVYFLGTEDEWNAISISDDASYLIEFDEQQDEVLSFGNGNEYLLNATVYFTFAKGDVDLDGHVTPADSRLIRRAAAGLEDISTVRSDMNTDEMIMADDARLALRVSAFLEDPAGMNCATPVSPTFTEFEGGADKVFVSGAQEDDQLTLTFSANDFAGTTDGQMYVGYDPEKLEYVSASVGLDDTDADDEGALPWKQTGNQDGVFTFAFLYQGQAAAEETELVTLTFNILDEDFGTVNYGFGDWNGSAVPAPGSYPVDEPNTVVIEYNGHRYGLFHPGTDWESAKTFCEEQGGHLAVLDSDSEHAVMTYLCADCEKTGSGGAWIGATLFDGTKEWVADQETDYSRWSETLSDYPEDCNYGYVVDWDVDCWGWGFCYSDGESVKDLVCEWDSVADCPWEADAVVQVVTYDFNGGDENLDRLEPQVVVQGESVTLPGIRYNGEETIKLHGWALGGETYLPGDECAITEDVTFTAQWGDHCTLTSSVAVDTEENTISLTISARDFVCTQSGDIVILYDNTQVEFLDAETPTAPGFFASFNELSGEAVTEYDEAENKGCVKLAFFFMDKAREEDFDLITLRFRALSNDIVSFYYQAVTWNNYEGWDPEWPGDGWNFAFGRPDTVYSYNGHSYALITNADIFDQAAAEALCELTGGHLATITTEQENAAVRYVACRAGDETETYAMTGGTYGDGIVGWITGEEADYSMWDEENQPQNEGAIMMIGFLGGFWEVAESRNALLCEWEPGECPWEADKTLYIVGFDGNGAEGAQSVMIAEADKAFALPDCDFAAPENKEFGGWTLNETVYAAGEETTVGEDTVFTAVWNDIPEEHTEHEWDAGEVTSAPTCTEDGEKTYTCTVCGETKVETVAATGHAWGEWTVIGEAACEEDGLEQRVCANDGEHIETKAIPMTGHSDKDRDGHCDVCRKDVCKYCGKIHPANIVGRFIQFFHNVAYFFAHLFGKM